MLENYFCWQVPEPSRRQAPPAHGQRPGGGGGATCSIDTVPDPAVITAGGSVDFSGNINGGKKTFSWIFEGGVPLNSTAQNVTVTYPNSGTFTASLSGTSSKGTCPTVSVDVIVNPVRQLRQECTDHQPGR